MEAYIHVLLNNNYKAISFFFDGVPDPATDSLIIPENVLLNLGDSMVLAYDTSATKTIRITYHDPYKFKGCSSCHDINSVGKMIEEEPTLCYQCHENFTSSYKFIHGPVAGGFCTSCHDPHQSKGIFLLKEPIHDLCLFCHLRENISPGEGHNIRDKSACNECHNPHGGTNRLMLKRDEI